MQPLPVTSFNVIKYIKLEKLTKLNKKHTKRLHFIILIDFFIKLLYRIALKSKKKKKKLMKSKIACNII